jgi:hypothetical protein
MCDICKPILPKYPFKHLQKHCPYAKSCFCSFCCDYGHLEIHCPDAPKSDPEPPKHIKATVEQPTEHALLIGNKDRVLRAFLFSKGISIAGKTEELQEKITEWALENGYENVNFV